MSHEIAGYEEPAGMPLVLGFMSNDILPQSVFAIQTSGIVPVEIWHNAMTGAQYTLEKHVVPNRGVHYLLTSETMHYVYAVNSPDVQQCDRSGVPLYNDTSPEILERQALNILATYNIERPAETLRSSTDRKFAGLIGQVMLDEYTLGMVRKLVNATPDKRASMLDILHDSVARRTPGTDPLFLRRSIRTAILSAARNR
ncbi:MAG: hypothetical protein WBP26_02960 [Candidatus Saccharimonadales bacterium]